MQNQQPKKQKKISPQKQGQDQQENISEKQSSQQGPSKIIPLILIPLFLVGIHFVLKRLPQWIEPCEKNFFAQVKVDPSQKWELFAKTGAVFSLLLFFWVLLCSLFRGALNPLENKEDPTPIQAINGLISNSFEQAAIFFPLFAYTLYFDKQAQHIQLLTTLAYLFLLGRVLFQLAYFLGNVLIGNSQIRTVGYLMNQICHATLIGLYFNQNLYEKITNIYEY